MIKKLISISFLLLYLAFLILPAYPLMHYYFFSSDTAFSRSFQQKAFYNGDHHTKTGDMAYLHALMKSADNDQTAKKAPNPPSSTNNEINNLVYLVSGNLQLAEMFAGIPLQFKNFSESLLNRPLQVLIPPPNFQA